jgi:uncharacterized protein with HEPN domain
VLCALSYARKSNAKLFVLRSQIIRLRDILVASERATTYARDMAVIGDLSRDRQAFDAMLYNLFVLGEAAKAVPLEIKQRWPEIEWRSMTGLRDVLAHEYFGIDDEIIWDTIKTKLPSLIVRLREIIESLEREGAP